MADEDPEFAELFGDEDDDDVDTGVGATEQDKAGGKSKKEKKDKGEKKEKSDKKEKGEKKEKKDKADKKEKKEKGDKKEKKAEKENDGEAPADADAKGPPPSSPSAGKDVLKIRRPTGTSPQAEAVTAPAADSKDALAPEAKDKKEKKDKKDKKDKKEKKEKKAEEATSSAAAGQAAEAPEAEKTDKKEKKDKKDKKEKKEKKRKGAPEDEQPQGNPEAAPVPTEIAPTDVIEEMLGSNDAMADILQDIGRDNPGTVPPTDDADMDNFVFADDAADAFQDFVDDLNQAPETDPDDHTITVARNDNIPRLIPLPDLERREKEERKELAQRKKPKIVHRQAQDVEEKDESLKFLFDEVMESLKLKRALTISENEASKFIEAFVQEMVEAAEKDIRAFEAKAPEEMKYKMNMLCKAVSVMQKFVFGELFVTFGGCRALALWLRTLPNGELPNAHLRTTLLNSMLRLPISKEALQNCKDPPLGQIVKNLMQNPREMVGNRKVAAMLVQKWVKQVLVKPLDLTLNNEEKEESARPMLPRKATETYESFLAAEEESFTRMHPTIPVREGKDYQIHPPATALALKRDRYAQDSNRFKLNEVLKVINRPNKKSWKPYEVSIAGRQLNQL